MELDSVLEQLEDYVKMAEELGATKAEVEDIVEGVFDRD